MNTGGGCWLGILEISFTMSSRLHPPKPIAWSAGETPSIQAMLYKDILAARIREVLMPEGSASVWKKRTKAKKSGRQKTHARQAVTGC
jgi:hypothetical protein